MAGLYGALRTTLLGAAVALCLTVHSASLASDDGAAWSIAELSGTLLLLADNVAPTMLRTGDKIEAGSRIRTGDDGRAVLMRGSDVITITPNTDLAIPADQPAFGTRLLQAAGRAIYEITRGPAPHFEVDSPFLAAVVKGTKFEVTSDASESAVRVFDGRVEVRNLADGRSAGVDAGQVGRVRPAPGYGVQVDTLANPSGGAGNDRGSGNGPSGGNKGGGEP